MIKEVVNIINNNNDNNNNYNDNKILIKLNPVELD